MVHMMHTKGTQVRERKRSAPRCCFQVMNATSNYNREIMSSCIKTQTTKLSEKMNLNATCMLTMMTLPSPPKQTHGDKFVRQ